MSMLRRRMMMGQSGADYSQMYLTFKALESGTFTFSVSAISYSLDGGSTWTSLPASTATPTIAAGQTICWKASGLTPTASTGIGTFSASALYEAYGNIMSLSDSDNYASATTIPNNYQFARLFRNDENLVSAKNLILAATTLKNYCYQQTFLGCTALTSVPELPAEALAPNCYMDMFNGCTALITAQATLPATSLTADCYRAMYRNCSSLTTAPELPSILLEQRCYYNLFNGCSSLNYIKCLARSISATECLYAWVTGVSRTGTFVKDASMTSWPTGTSGIPSGWTVEDAT